MGKKKLPPPQDLNRLKEVCVRVKKSRAFLSKELGVSPATVSLWFSNKAQPHLSDLNRIADLLDVDICDLLVRTKQK